MAAALTYRDPTLAAAANFVIPGLGYGFVMGLFWWIMTGPLLVVGHFMLTMATGFVGPLILATLTAIHAHQLAKANNKRLIDLQVATASKRCPQCAETVNAAAIVCRYCQFKFFTVGSTDAGGTPS